MTEILFARKDDVDNISLVDIIAGLGLSGGGNITGPGDITLNLDINELTVGTPVPTDTVAFYDASDGTIYKVALSALFTALVPGADTEIIFNDGGTYGADPGFTYNKTTDTLGLSANSRIGFDGTDVIIIHGPNILTFNGASSGYLFDAAVAPLTNDGAQLGTATKGWSDLLLATGGTLNWNNGDLILTQTSSTISHTAAATVDAGYSLDAAAGHGSFIRLRSGAINWLLLAQDTSESGDLQFLGTDGATARMKLSATRLAPSVNDGLALGDTTNMWSDLRLALGGTINWNNGNIILTHSAGDIALTGGSLTLPNTGLHLLDTNGSHDLIIAPGSDLTVDRTLTITTGDANRTLTISGNATVSQDYSTTGNPQFATIELGAASDTTLARASAGDITIEGNIIYRAGGTNVAIADGGTNADTAAGAATNLGLGTGDSPQFTAINIGHATDTTITRTAAGTIAVEGNVIYRAGGTDVPVTDGGTGASDAATARTNLGVPYGKQTVWVPAAAMIPRATNGPAVGLVEMTTNKNMVKTLDFDATTQEFAQFDIRMPKSWDESTVTFIPVWSHAATATNFGVVWGLDAVAISNDDTLDVAFGTAQTSTDTGGTTNDSYQGPESSAITIAGTPAEGDYVQFRIHRDPANGSDTMAIDARLHGVLLLYTNNTTNDT